MGGGSVGLLTATGGGAIALGLATGGGAIGGIAAGGGAAGFIAQGGGAIGYYARGGGVVGVHTIPMPPAPPSAQAQGVFDSLSWFLGAWPVNAVASLQPFVVTAGLTILAAALLGLAAWRVHRNRSPEIVDVASTGPRA
jgi:hypothetical protein